MAYATVDELIARFKRSGAVVHNDEDTLGEILEAASGLIDGFCNRTQDGFSADTVATARVYVGDGGLVTWIDECVEVTAVAVKTSINESSYSAWDTTDWQAGFGDPRFGNFNRTPYQYITITQAGSQTGFTSGQLNRYSEPTVQVTGKWGFAAVGDRVFELLREATVSQCMRWFQRFKTGFADTTGGPDTGTIRFRLSKEKLDPDIQTMLVEGRLVRDANAEDTAMVF